MSYQNLPTINQKKLIKDFLRDGRVITNESIGNSDIDMNLETNKSQQYFMNPQPYHNSYDKSSQHQNSISSNHNRSNLYNDKFSNNSNYYVTNTLSSVGKQSFTKLKENKSSLSQNNCMFTPFFNERDSLGNLLKEQDGRNKVSDRSITYKSKAKQNLSPYLQSKSSRKNRILPESSHAIPQLARELDQNALQRRKVSEQIGNEPSIDKYTKFVVKLNSHENQIQRNLEETKALNSEERYQDTQSFQFQNFTSKNRVKPNNLKMKTQQNEQVLNDILNQQKQNDQKQNKGNQSQLINSKSHLKIRNINHNQSYPSVGIYNPNYSLIQRNIQTHRIQPILESNRSSQQQHLQIHKFPIVGHLLQSPNTKKIKQNQDADDNYEKLFNKMMKEIKKKVDQEQLLNQGNFLHPDGDKELKKVMSSEEMEGFTNQYKKQMADMKNIFNRIRQSLNQNKQFNSLQQ